MFEPAHCLIESNKNLNTVLLLFFVIKEEVLTFSAQAKFSIRNCPFIFSRSRIASNFSRHSIMTGSVSKSGKWLWTWMKVIAKITEGSL